MTEHLNGDNLKKLYDESYTVSHLNDSEFIDCLDCEAMDHFVKLQDLNEDTCGIEYQKKLRDALLFVLQNIEWTDTDHED